MNSIKGSDSSMRTTKCGLLTQWIEVTPLELKLTIEMQIVTAADPK
jgi:hypothetical protein